MIVRQFADWYTARDKCGEENGQLAVFTSPQDQDFFKGQTIVWILFAITKTRPFNLP